VYCWALRSLSEGFGELENLQTLLLGDCQALVSLPERFGELENLKILYVPSHMEDETFPHDLRKVLEDRGCKINSSHRPKGSGS